MSSVIIYSLSDPISGVVKYIGQTSKTLDERLSVHIKDSKYKKNNKRNSWIKSIIKKGLTPLIEIVDEVLEEDWKFWEMYWIEQFKVWGFDLKNGTTGGDGIKGYIHTEKDKEKMRGRILSKETKEKMSRSKKGKPAPWSVKIGLESSKKVKQFDLKNNLINEYKSISHASKKTGISICNISRVCCGKRKTAGKFIWKFV